MLINVEAQKKKDPLEKKVKNYIYLNIINTQLHLNLSVVFFFIIIILNRLDYIKGGKPFNVNNRLKIIIGMKIFI